MNCYRVFSCCHIVDFGTHYNKMKLEVEKELRRWTEDQKRDHQLERRGEKDTKGNDKR